MGATTRTAVVTGSSSGIGKAIALRLLQSGYAVVLNYSTNEARAAETLSECNKVSPHALMVRADVSNSGAVADLIQLAVDEFGRLDVLINNAARAIDRPALDLTEDEWDSVLNVNLKGAFLCSQYAARQMLKQSGGTIINIGASTGIRGRRNGANTCASKAGLMMLTQCLALELGPDVRVNTIVPGFTLTNEAILRFGLDDDGSRRTREANVPLGRLGEPQDIADAVMLLLSPDARFVTGQKLVVDGGQYMW